MAPRLGSGEIGQRDMATRGGHLAPAAQSTSEPQHGSAVRQDPLPVEYLRIAGRYRWVIAAFSAAGLVLGLLLTVQSMPVYRTRTSLEIQGVNSDFMNVRAVAPTGDNSPAGTDINLQTQIKILQSDSLLQKVEDRLLAEPHPASMERRDWLTSGLRALHLPHARAIRYEDLVEEAAQRVKVKPLGVTRLVEVTCESWDPAFTARFCNTLTQEFQSTDAESRVAEAHKTSTWLTGQLGDVRLREEEAQKRLNAAVGGNGLMLSQTTTQPGEERLRELQDELVKATADRMQKEASIGVARSVNTDTVPNVQDSPAYRQYAEQLAQLRSKVAELVPPLTEENPRVIHLRSQIREAEAGMEAARSSSTGRQSNEYTAAKHREDLLRAAYRAQEQSVSSDLQKGAEVSLLRREVESSQQLYQTLLQRAKEAEFAAAMPASTVHVVDAAKKPKTPSSPGRAMNAAGGLLLGALFGVGFSFFRERTSKLVRAPGEIEQLLQVHELGVIPHAAPLPARAGVTKLLSHTVGTGASGKEDTENGQTLALTRWNDNFSIAAEAYRSVTLSLLLSDRRRKGRTYVVSSPSDGEGKTTVVSNLGVALTKSRMRVALLDGDLRKPKLHRAFGLREEWGMRNLLRGEIDLENSPTSQFCTPTEFPNLFVIPAGSGHEDSVELLHSPRMAMLLARLAREFDAILIDTPPMLHMADARILAGHSHGAILVFRAGSTGLREAELARDLFDRDGVRLLGTILNDFDPSREGWSEYYSSYKRYGGGDDPAVHEVAAR